MDVFYSLDVLVNKRDYVLCSITCFLLFLHLNVHMWNIMGQTVHVTLPQETNRPRPVQNGQSIT